MGGQNPKYQQFNGLWAVKFSYDNDAGCDCVEAVFPITSPRQYWSCDMNRMTDIHSSEESARESEQRVRATYEAALKRKADAIQAENDTAEQTLRVAYGDMGWFLAATDDSIKEIAAHLAGCADGWEEDESFVRSLFV